MAIIGIDLGTSNSLASIWKDGKVQLLKNNLGSYLTPSVVSVDSDGQILVGEAAKDRLISHPDLSVAYFKRYMGMTKVFKVGDKNYTPEELSSFVLRKIKMDAEVALGETVTEVVISVPAYFNDNQRQATKTAARMAGLKIDRIVNEPSAAALACRYEDTRTEQVFLVVDFGGGTLDVSVVDCYENVIEIVAVAGDNRLGGNDFDDIIFEEFCQRNEIDKLSSNEKAILMRKAEQCKRELSEKEEAEIWFSYKNEEKRMTFTNELLTKCAASLLLRLKTVIEKAIKDSHIALENITDIILVGGSSKMPVVRRYISYLFKCSLNTKEEADLLIGSGIGVYTGIMQRKEEIQDIMMTDVCPFTLGIDIVNPNGEGPLVMAVMIPRNSILPNSITKAFVTTVDNQRHIEFGVYQGEAYYCNENILLGKLTITVPPAPKGQEVVHVTFTYDINGVLEVEILNRLGEKSRKVIIDKNSTLTEKEIEENCKALSKVKMLATDQEENRSVLALAERLYMETDGVVRDFVVNCIQVFTAALSSNSKIRILKTREKVVMHLVRINMQVNRSIFDTLDELDFAKFDEFDERDD